MPNLQLDTDCEGPLALNDNAFELCREFIKPQGDRFFQQVSRYDDYLTEVAKRPEYKSGDTLKLILPFLKAHGLTNAQIGAYSRKNVTLVPGAEGAFKFLHGRDFPIFEISTSYRPFAEAVGLKLGFKKERIFCTELDLDRHTLSAVEAEELQRLQGEIVAAPSIQLPPDAAAVADLPAPVQEAIAVLDRIFWERLPAMEIGALLPEVNPIGGPEKAKAVTDSLAQTKLSMADLIYVGDSITDVQAFEAVRAGGGLAISFNGNRYAVNAAEVIVVADSAWPLAMLTAIFQLWGKDGVLEVASPETRAKSRSLVLPEAVIEPIAMGLEGHIFNLYDQSADNLEKVVEESQAMRAKLRGETVAALG
jgi:predicted HAD superfamily phosphohydrolase